MQKGKDWNQDPTPDPPCCIHFPLPSTSSSSYFLHRVVSKSSNLRKAEGETAPWNGVGPPWASNRAAGTVPAGFGLCHVDLVLTLTGDLL